MGDCVIAMRKSLTARFTMKQLGGVRSFLLLKHMIEKSQFQSTQYLIEQNNMLHTKQFNNRLSNTDSCRSTAKTWTFNTITIILSCSNNHTHWRFHYNKKLILEWCRHVEGSNSYPGQYNIHSVPLESTTIKAFVHVPSKGMEIGNNGTTNNSLSIMLSF